jgi:hypothetical protein
LQDSPDFEDARRAGFQPASVAAKMAALRGRRSMAYFQDAEIETMLADWDNVLTAGDLSVPCLLDEHDELQLEFEGAAGQIARQVTAVIRTTDLPDLAANAEITIDGIEYTVWRRLLLGDGALSQLWLRIDSGGGGS